MTSPLVSVVIPTYNHGRYIGRCIDSLLAQTYGNWELVVVDDGCTDDTPEIVKAYDDRRISYMRQENRGVKFLAATMNEGVRRTKGELITMFASDDMWPPYRLEKQVPVFRDLNVVLCFGRGILIDENDRHLGEFPLPAFVTEVMNRPVGSVLRTLLVSNWLPQYTVLLRRSALEKIGLYLQPAGLLAEDWPTHLALALEGEFRYLDLPLGYYRMHPDQMTRNHFEEMVKTDAQYALPFFRTLEPAMQELSGWTEASLVKEAARRLDNSHFYLGRKALAFGDRPAARGHFVAALARGGLRTKAQACVGLSCLALGLDLERIAKFLGRPPLR